MVLAGVDFCYENYGLWPWQAKPRPKKGDGGPDLQYRILIKMVILHGPSMFAVKAKIYGVLYNQASSIAFDETSSYWSALKSS